MEPGQCRSKTLRDHRLIGHECICLNHKSPGAKGLTILTHFTQRLRHGLLLIEATLLPQTCLLCGSATPLDKTSSRQNELLDVPLCAPCANDLPQLLKPGCPCCALPTSDGGRCGACLRHPPHFDATQAAWRYAFPLDRLVHLLKYQHRLSVTNIFIDALHHMPPPLADADLMLAVPLSKQRLQQRGFNQALEIARPLARRMQLPLLTSVCERVRDTTAQARLPWKERQKNIRAAFECHMDLSGRRIIVVDDVMTTGATLDEFARILKRQGAAAVGNWVVARAVKDHP
jgi:ComF family protein